MIIKIKYLKRIFTILLFSGCSKLPEIPIQTEVKVDNINHTLSDENIKIVEDFIFAGEDFQSGDLLLPFPLSFKILNTIQNSINNNDTSKLALYECKVDKVYGNPYKYYNKMFLLYYEQFHQSKVTTFNYNDVNDFETHYRERGLTETEPIKTGLNTYKYLGNVRSKNFVTVGYVEHQCKIVSNNILSNN